jgi:hypothetical protein
LVRLARAVPSARGPEPGIPAGGRARPGDPHGQPGTFGPRFRYVEQIIEKDAPIFALGEVTRVDRALYEDEEDDGDPGEDDLGVEDGDGWQPEPNRLGLVPTADAVVAADMARATWTIGAAKGQPFLVSTEHPEAVSAEQELGAKGGMIMGGIFAALALFLAWARVAG